MDTTRAGAGRDHDDRTTAGGAEGTTGATTRAGAVTGPADVALEHVACRLGGVEVLRDVSLHAAPGRVYGLLGPNGAGKSTTLAVALGLVRPTAGTVRLLGRPWSRELLAHVGASVGGPSVYGHLTGRQNLDVHARLVSVDREAVRQALARTGLEEVADRRARRYSTGMRSRLATAIALLGEPQVVVLDEPQDGLDPVGVRQVRDLVRGLADAGRTVVLSSHVLPEVAALADDVGCVVAGASRFEGRLADLAPDGDVERAYLDLVAGTPA
ncbi:ABC transporter ATP-binding protein [Pseudokineococcus sp. 1T1Z-3]|uniref:ABC transporter ATP-binding protein n=1 Tax=Pseudokineococcus sp. 1T1Z-3 TaxID=3132745 RepID=UPI0030B6B072